MVHTAAMWLKPAVCAAEHMPATVAAAAELQVVQELLALEGYLDQRPKPARAH